MFKKTALIFSATLISAVLMCSSTFAGDDINPKIRGLIKEQEIDESVQEEIKLVIPENKDNFLFSTFREGTKPIGTLSSSQLPLHVLNQRDAYDDYALIFSGNLETNVQYWNGSRPKSNQIRGGGENKATMDIKQFSIYPGVSKFINLKPSPAIEQTPLSKIDKCEKISEEIKPPKKVEPGASIPNTIKGPPGTSPGFSENINGKSDISFGSGRAINLSNVSIYTIANMGHYVTGALMLSGTGTNSGEASLDIKNAFVTFGNLKESPFYVTVGKSRLSLGSFSGGGSFTSSLTRTLFRPNNVANASISYYDNGLNTNVSLFQIDKYKTGFSAAAFYNGSLKKIKYDFNIGYIYDLNGTGQKSFNQENQRIGASNIDLSLKYNIFTISSGYAQTTNKCLKGNKPESYASAWYFKGSISPNILGEPTTFSTSYHGAYNTENIKTTIALSGMKNNVSASINKIIIASIERKLLTDNVSIGAEYAHMRMYNNKHNNTYTLSLSAYF